MKPIDKPHPCDPSRSATKTFQPRYLAYCKANGRTPEQQMAHDEAEYPGGKMCGFILWIQANKIKFAKQHPQAMLDDTIMDQRAWDRFLSAQAHPCDAKED